MLTMNRRFKEQKGWNNFKLDILRNPQSLMLNAGR